MEKTGGGMGHPIILALRHRQLHNLLASSRGQELPVAASFGSIGRPNHRELRAHSLRPYGWRGVRADPFWLLPGSAPKVDRRHSDGAPPSRRLAGRHLAAPVSRVVRRQDAAEPSGRMLALRELSDFVLEAPLPSAF